MNNNRLKQLVTEEVNNNLRYTASLNEGILSTLLRYGLPLLGGAWAANRFIGRQRANNWSNWLSQTVNDVSNTFTGSLHPGGTVETVGNTSNNSEAMTNLDAAVERHLGVPYVYGGNSDNGMDCSAFTQKVMKETYGVNLPRTAKAQKEAVQEVSLDNIQKGDLVFLKGTSSHRGPNEVSHVGIYMGNGKVAHASSSKRQTMIASFNNYWTDPVRFAGVGRIA